MEEDECPGESCNSETKGNIEKFNQIIWWIIIQKDCLLSTQYLNDIQNHEHWESILHGKWKFAVCSENFAVESQHNKNWSQNEPRRVLIPDQKQCCSDILQQIDMNSNIFWQCWILWLNLDFPVWFWDQKAQQLTSINIRKCWQSRERVLKKQICWKMVSFFMRTIGLFTEHFSWSNSWPINVLLYLKNLHIHQTWYHINFIFSLK